MSIEHIRQKIEKILWREYKGGHSPNMEQVSEEITQIFHSEPEKVTKSLEHKFEDPFSGKPMRDMDDYNKALLDILSAFSLPEDK